MRPLTNLSTVKKRRRNRQAKRTMSSPSFPRFMTQEWVVRDAVNTRLATPVDKMVKTMLSEDNAKENLAKYNRPQNCENLASTTVDPEIWWKMRSNSKSKDLRMQKIETSMLKSMHPVINLADKLLIFIEK